MKKLFIFPLVIFLTACASYGYYPNQYENRGPRYECHPYYDSVVCYDNHTGRMFSYHRTHTMYNYWYNYTVVRPRYVPQRSQPRGVATPRGYKAPPTRVVPPQRNQPQERVAVPRRPSGQGNPPRVQRVPPRTSVPRPTVRPPSTRLPDQAQRKPKPRSGGN